MYVEMKNIYKSFPGVKALQAVDFTLCEGEIHALMGENGAGKSTLIKVLTGVYEKDRGDIFLKEHEGATRRTESWNQHGVPGDYTLSEPFRGREHVHRTWKRNRTELEEDECGRG